ncbi:serine/threonine-protein kinase [Nonomuraea sediminis]|uniref:serine/threonine-protein kinase n=1 Tax=Nonomuraea sediminis TaxID=2835864 RepID=UPI001BDD7885|nr:serine/threonine-protein kinase [Nonomuraea sediminis]
MHQLATEDPRRLGDYVVTGVLGRGGQGSVYLGEGSGGRVAIKVLHTADPQAHRRFLREADAARRVAAFCTARVLDVGVRDGRPYIISEHIPGPSLDLLVKNEGPRSGSGLERLAVATLTALAAIHRAGVVHRDFKPTNVIMGPEGPVVIDFGIARALEHTATSTVMGTPAYMAPEQFEGGTVTAAADMFSWASAMVFASTGRQAFRGETMPALMHAILTNEPDLAGVPENLRPLLAACLTKNPAARPTAADLLATMTGDVPQTQTRRLPEPATGPVKPRQNPVTTVTTVAAGVGLVFAVLAGIIALVQTGANLMFHYSWPQSSAWGATQLLRDAVLAVAAPALITALWPVRRPAAITMALLAPPALAYLAWDWLDLSLRIGIPALALAGLVIFVAGILTWQAGKAASAVGAVAGALVGLDAVLWAVERSGGFRFDTPRGIVDNASRVMVAAWLITLAVTLLRQAVLARGGGRSRPGG